MSERFEVKENERGIVRLFAVDLPAQEIERFAERDYEADVDDPPWPLQDALGVTYLDEDFVELFPVEDLTGLGLTGYMTEGLGIAEADVDQDRARLEGLKGHLLFVFSSAFGGFADTLRPRAPLRWVGTYVEETAPVTFEPLSSEAARGEVTGGQATVPAHRGRGSLLVVVGIVIVLLIGMAVVLK